MAETSTPKIRTTAILGNFYFYSKWTNSCRHHDVTSGNGELARYHMHTIYTNCVSLFTEKFLRHLRGQKWRFVTFNVLLKTLLNFTNVCFETSLWDLVERGIFSLFFVFFCQYRYYSWRHEDYYVICEKCGFHPFRSKLDGNCKSGIVSSTIYVYEYQMLFLDVAMPLNSQFHQI